jgi:hypothetical protein
MVMTVLPSWSCDLDFGRTCPLKQKSLAANHLFDFGIRWGEFNLAAGGSSCYGARLLARWEWPNQTREAEWLLHGGKNLVQVAIRSSLEVTTNRVQR